MQYINKHNTEIPALGFGTWQLKGDECVRSVQKALETGYRHIDTAQAYDNEEFVGKGMKEFGIDRDQYFLVTKMWMDNFAPDKFGPALEESLQKLRVDYVDLLLLHWPSGDHEMKQTLDLLVKAKEEGKARLIGVSNYTIELLEEAKKHTGNQLATNQVEFHPFLDQRPLLRWLDDHDMFLTGYSPLSRGDVLENETMKNIGEKYGKTSGQVSLRWALQHEQDVSVIPKSGTPDHIESNFDIFDFELSQEEMIDITNLARPDGRKVNPDFAPDWDTPKIAA